MTAEAPYPGLHPFDREEADVFFGREEQTDQLLAKLDRHRFLAVVGPSGCGKSSLVRAGLIANLSAGFMATAGARWRIALMRPGRRPMRRLAEALLGESALGPERENGPDALGFLGATLWRGPLGLVEVLRETPLPADTNLLLLVDQFEEIFRFRNEKERDEADAFVALMVESAEQQEFPIYVVMTMRSDYIGDCGLFTGLPEHVSESQFLTPRLTRDQREAAITGPARVFGGDVDQRLVSRLLNETSSDPDHLPVLQHLLMRMWNRALHEARGEGARPDASEVIEGQSPDVLSAETPGPLLNLTDCNAVGGLRSALSNHANEAYDGLNEDQQRLAEVMFRRLCELGSDHMYTRRPTSIQEVSEVAGAKPELVMEVAEVFREADTNFIVPGHPEPLYPETYLDISHESLIRQWDRLQAWAKEEEESAKSYLRLAGTAELWQRNEAALWGTPNLETAQKWQREQDPNAEWAHRYGGDFSLAMRFLEESEKAQTEKREEEEREQREKEENLRKLAEVERKRAEQQERLANTEQQRAKDQEAAARKYRRVAAAAGVLFIVAACTSVWGWISAEQAGKAESKAKAAESKALAGEATALAGEAKLVAILSEQALRGGDNRTALRIPLDMFVKNAERVDKLKGIPNVPASRKLASALQTSENALFKALYRPVGTVLKHPARLYAANFSDDGRLVVTAADDGTVRIWEVATGKEVGEPIEARGQARWASFDHEGHRIVVAYFNASSPTGSTAKVWDRREKRFVATLSGHQAPLNFAAFSSDGATILTTSFDETARLWNATDGTLFKELKGHTKGVLSADFDPTGARIVTASFDYTARIWDAATGKQIGTPLVHTAPVISARFDGDGKYIVTASMDRNVRVWDPAACEKEGQACKPLRTLRGHRKRVTSAMFSSDGARILTASSDKTVRVWDWRHEATLVALQGPSGSFGWISRAVFSPSPAEDRLLAMFGGTSAYIWDLKSHEPAASVVLRGHTEDVKFADFDVTGNLVVTASMDKTARVWDLSNAQQIQRFEHDDPVFSAAFDPTGRWIITAAGTAAHIWDHRTGERVRVLEGHENRLSRAMFAPVGDRGVTSSIDGTARIWNTSTGAEITVFGDRTNPVKHVAFAPDGKRVVTASTDGKARVWDVATGDELHVLTGHSGAVTSAEFDADGRRIVTVSKDKKLRVWDAESGSLIRTYQSEPPIPLESATFSPDGRYIAVAASDGSARIMDADSGTTLATLHRHGDAVNWAAFNADGKQIVTASADGTARVWRIASDLASKIEFACQLLAPLTEQEQELLHSACSPTEVSAR